MSLEKNWLNTVQANPEDNLISDELVQNLEESIEVDTQTNSILLSVNWNNLSIKEISDMEELEIFGAEIMESNSNIDSVIFLKAWPSDDEYEFYVYERDWSLSVMCGNWAIASAYLLHQRHCKNSIKLITRYWTAVQTNIQNWKISVNFDEVKVNEDLDSILSIKSNLQDIAESIDNFLENPELLKNAVSDNQELTYYLQLFNNLKNDEWFKSFVEHIFIRDYKYVSWEPHLIINFEYPGDSDFVLNYYLKALSFLLRYSDKWENNIHGDINIMFYQELWDEVNIYPSERGVNNGIHMDQTWACGSWSVALASYLLSLDNEKDSVCIKNRSWSVLEVRKWNPNSYELCSDVENISHIQEKANSYFDAEAIHENFLYNMSRIWLDVEWKTYSEILNQLSNVPASAKEINKLFDNKIFSSCLHETEYPIDPYKISSSVNAAIFADKMWLDDIYSPYLDTLTDDLKEFPNVKTKQWKVFKKMPWLIEELNELIYNWETSLKDILLYLRNRSNFISEIEKQEWNKKMLDALKKIESLFNNILWVEVSNLADSEFWKYVLSYLSKAWLLELFHENIEMKNNKVDQMILDLFEANIKSRIDEIFENFVKSLLRIDCNDLETWDIKKLVDKALQDSVLTYTCQKFLDWDMKKLLRDKWVLDKHYRFDKSISSMDPYFKEKLSNSFVSLLDDPEMWQEIFIKYFEKLFENKWKPVLLWEFNDEKNGFNWMKIFFSKEKWSNEYKIMTWTRKEAFELNYDYFFDLLRNPNNIVNPQWALLLFVKSLWMVPMYGSERWYREITVDTLKEHLDNDKYSDYINYVQASWLVSDYDPSVDLQGENIESYYTKFPSWTDNTYCSDLLMEAIMPPSDFSKEMLDRFLQRNLVDHSLSNWEKVKFLKLVIWYLNKYNFDYIIDTIIEQLKEKWNTDKISKMSQLRELVNYDWNDIPKLIDCIRQRYLLINKL